MLGFARNALNPTYDIYRFGGRPMKIQRVRSEIVSLPADEPLADGKGTPGGVRDYVAVKVFAGGGIEGIGVAGFGGALTPALKSAIDSLGELAVGEDACAVERYAAKVMEAAGSAGPGGVLMLALSAIDMALWDIRGKALGVSVSKLLGGRRPAFRPMPAAR